jgi:hypothetical protein
MDDSMERTIGELVVITDHCTTDNGFIPRILTIDLSDGEVEFTVQASD